MNILLFYKSSERMPYAIHICDKYTSYSEWQSVSLMNGDSESIINDYDYFLEFNATDNWDEKKIVELLEKFSTDIKAMG